VALSQCAFVGDNVNDLQVMKAAGFAVGVNIKHPDVEQAVDHVVSGSDLKSLLDLFPGVDWDSLD
jgi:3-deoxy-D-manno-octulosonate 8-phosphate phosphatase KdsC-like HAD superfamily phosphatase